MRLHQPCSLFSPSHHIQLALTGCVMVAQTKFVGMMQYDGDLKLPARFLVPPPAISGVSGELLAREGVTTFACSETQKFGHVSPLLDPEHVMHRRVLSTMLHTVSR